MRKLLYSVGSLLPDGWLGQAEDVRVYQMHLGTDAEDVHGMNLMVAEFLIRFANVLVEVHLVERVKIEMKTIRSLDGDELKQLEDLVEENGYEPVNFPRRPKLPPASNRYASSQFAGALC